MSGMRGWLRQDGRKGIRNVVAVAYLVECAHHVAREIALPLRENDVHVIGFPGCYPNDYAHMMLERLCTHPNVGAGTAGLARLRKFRSLPAGGVRRCVRASGPHHHHPAHRRHAFGDRRGARLGRRTPRRTRYGRRPYRWMWRSW